MARHSIRTTRLIALIGAIYVVIALIQLAVSAPIGVRGLVLDRDLAITPGSQRPTPNVAYGDRVVAVNGQPVAAPRELAAMLARSDAPVAEVTIEQRGRMRTVTLSALRFERDPPPDLLTAERIARVDDQRIDGYMRPSELTEYLERAAPTPIEVEYELARARLAGPVEVARIGHHPVTVAWLALGLLGVLGICLLWLEEMSPRQVDLLTAVVAGLGALSLASITALIATPETPPAFLMWAIALTCAWRATAVVARPSVRTSDIGWLLVSAPAAIAAAGALIVGVSAGHDGPVVPWLGRLSSMFLVGAGLSAAYFASAARSAVIERGSLWWGRSIAMVVAAAWCGVLLLMGRVEAWEAAAWALLVGGVGFWVSDVRDAVRAGPMVARERLWGAASSIDAASGCRCLDAIARAVGPSGEVSAAVVVEGLAVELRLDSDPSEPRLSVERLEDPLAATLVMLALEGGMVPRPQRGASYDADDDPLDDLTERLGIIAAVPLRPGDESDASTVFVLLRPSEDDEAPRPDVPAFVSSVARSDSEGVANAFIAAAAGHIARASLGRTAQRTLTDSTRDLQGPVANTDPEPAPVQSTQMLAPIATPEQSGVGHASNDVGATNDWALHLEEAIQRTYPVDEPDALDDREWAALSFLRESVKPALLVGEASVGKEFVARAVHTAMWGQSRRFATVDFAVRPPSVAEAELFGDDDATGLVDLVGDGTLLLKSASSLGDERLQAIVPRLERSRVRVVFAERYRGAETGVPASLPHEIRRCTEHRNVHLSPLRDRPEDLARFARYFAHRAAMRYGAEVVELSEDAVDYLTTLDLAANFVDLDALITGAVLRARGRSLSRDDLTRVGAEEADVHIADGESPEDGDAERAEIVDALSRSGENRTRAAELLGMTRGKLLRRLKKYGLD